MSDIVERLRTAASNNRAQAERGTTTTGEILTALGCQTKEAVAGMHDEAADEIDRLRSLLKEAGEAMERLLKWVEPIAGDNRDSKAEQEEHASVEFARTVLSKIKGEA